MSRTNELAQLIVGLQHRYPSTGREKKYFVVTASGMERANKMLNHETNLLLATSGWAVWMNEDMRVCRNLDEVEDMYCLFTAIADGRNKQMRKHFWDIRRAERTAELHMMWGKQAAEFIDFADAMEPRQDWHEPDEQGIEAVVHGSRLDNACGDSLKSGEFVIELKPSVYPSTGIRGVLNNNMQLPPSATINLADLLAHYQYLINWQKRQNGVG